MYTGFFFLFLQCFCKFEITSKEKVKKILFTIATHKINRALCFSLIQVKLSHWFDFLFKEGWRAWQNGGEMGNSCVNHEERLWQILTLYYFYACIIRHRVVLSKSYWLVFFLVRSINHKERYIHLLFYFYLKRKYAFIWLSFVVGQSLFFEQFWSPAFPLLREPYSHSTASTTFSFCFFKVEREIRPLK